MVYIVEWKPMNIQEHIEIFLQKAQAITDSYYHTNYTKVEIPKILVSYGKKYAKVFRANSTARSVVCFIDLTDGDILRPEGWNAPSKRSKGKRGNVHDEFNGTQFYEGIGNIKYL